MALSTKQRACIEAIIANPMKAESKVIEEMGLTNRTFYNWKKEEEFMAALQERLKEKWKDAEGIAIESMIKLCKEGNFNAAKYILDNLGYKPEEKIKAEVSGNMDINIVIGEE